jgi:hypothetical protein
MRWNSFDATHQRVSFSGSGSARLNTDEVRESVRALLNGVLAKL